MHTLAPETKELNKDDDIVLTIASNGKLAQFNKKYEHILNSDDSLPQGNQSESKKSSTSSLTSDKAPTLPDESLYNDVIWNTE